MAVVGQIRPRPAPQGVRTPLFLVGVGLALFAFVAMFAFGIIFARTAQGSRDVDVVVAGQDIQPRQPITPDMLQFSSLPASAMPPHAFTKITQLTGFSALVTIYKNQVLTANVVSSNPDDLAAVGTSSFLPIPAGWVALTLPSSEQQGVAGYVAPGDYINIVATVNIQLILLYPNGSSSTVNQRQVTRTVFTDVKVIRVGPISAAPKEGQPQGVASSVTVVMTLCDAQYMIWLIQNASLKYVLLSVPDYAKDTPQPDVTCPATSSPEPIGPKEVDARWEFTKG
jgi:pilus assembly protein CpaB